MRRRRRLRKSASGLPLTPDGGGGNGARGPAFTQKLMAAADREPTSVLCRAAPGIRPRKTVSACPPSWGRFGLARAPCRSRERPAQTARRIPDSPASFPKSWRGIY